MNAATPLSDRAYGNSALRSARDSEYDIISRVTRMLRQADGDPDRIKTIQAVHKNNELWTALAADLGHPDNALPGAIKAGLISLAFFSLRHGEAVMAGVAKVGVLIDINMAVLRGLRGEASA